MDSLKVHLDGGPGSAAAARIALREAEFVDGLADGVRIDLELLVSELVSNGVRHAHAEDLTLGVERVADCLRVRCWDDGPGFEGPPRPPSVIGQGGFGLMLVDRLADRWGVDRLAPGGCCVWFELAA